MQYFIHNFWVIGKNKQAYNKKITKSKLKGREKKPRTQNIIVKLPETKTKENYKGSQKIKEASKKAIAFKDSPKETIETAYNGVTSLKCRPQIQYPVKTSFINEDKVNSQRDKSWEKSAVEGSD